MDGLHFGMLHVQVGSVRERKVANGRKSPRHVHGDQMLTVYGHRRHEKTGKRCSRVRQTQWSLYTNIREWHKIEYDARESDSDTQQYYIQQSMAHDRA